MFASPENKLKASGIELGNCPSGESSLSMLHFFPHLCAKRLFLVSKFCLLVSRTS